MNNATPASWLRKCVGPIALLSILFTLLLPVGLTAQRPREQPPQPYTSLLITQLKQLQSAALASDYAYRQVAHLSNNIGPRLSGSAQAQKAVEYVAGELRRLGLDVKLEEVTVPHWVRGLETAELIEFPGQAAGTTQKVILTALGGSVATPPEGLTADVVIVNNFDELNALGRQKVAGKVVLFNERYDKQMAAEGFGPEAYGQAVVYRGAGPSAAARLGAVAALIRSVGNADFRLPHTGVTRYATDAPQVPAAAVSAEDADLLAHLSKEGEIRLHMTLTPRLLPDAHSFNVVADLKGSDKPQQVVIVSGHLDSWDLGTGAIDDGAGVAVAMAVAQLVKSLGFHPTRTIRVVAWMNEENGLAGGRTYAKDHASEIASTYAAIESDLGAGHPVGINFNAKRGVVPLIAPAAAILESSGAGLIRMNEDTGADISPLSAAGVPTFSPIQDGRSYFNYHHTAADTLDKIVPRELAENAAVMTVLAYALANIPQELPKVDQE